MNWNEAATRLGQEFSKRVDLFLYRSGIGYPELPLREISSSQAKSDHAKFFFGPDQLGNRADLLRTHMPNEADAIIHEANEICRHEFRLLGCEKIGFGQEIDWHFSKGKQDVRGLPWFKINFLDFDAVGDHKFVWELNRHQHFVTLAKAWVLTSKAEYVNELAAQWRSWQKSNPYPLGINWASALEAAFRSLSWLWVRNLLVGCAELPDSVRTELLRGLQLHGRHIERYLSTYFSPNTHLLGEAVALFFIGTLCPEIPASRRWRNLGWRILLRESERQVRPDGVYFEQALYYHVYALDFFLHARLIASQNGIAIPNQFDDVLKRMLDVLRVLSENGPIEGFGDDDGGRVFNPRHNRVECMTDPLAIGAGLYGDEYANATLTEESIWLLGEKVIQSLAGRPAVRVAVSQALPAGGIYLMNDSEPFAQQLMIDAGPQGVGSCGHGHADALSIRLSMDGRRFLIDPGTYCYVSGADDRNEFRGTGAHNTIRVDGLDQAIPQGPFAWSSIPRAKVETWIDGQTFDFFLGSHDGYGLSRLAIHKRLVFHVKGGAWLISDSVEGRGEHLLESFWHFAPEVEVATVGDVISADYHEAAPGKRTPGLAFVLDRNSDWQADVTRGFVSPAYGAKQVARVLRFSTKTKVPEQCGVLLVPRTRQCDGGDFRSIGEKSQRAVRAYRYQMRGSSEFFFFAEENSAWSCGPWTSDSKLLYCRLERRRLMHIIVLAGTFASYGDVRFISQPSASATIEWVNGSEVRSRASAAVLAQELAVQDSDILDSVP
jgi:hypothetical protein